MRNKYYPTKFVMPSIPPLQVEPWELQDHEPPFTAFHAFTHFRDLPERTIDKAWHQHHADCVGQPKPSGTRAQRAWFWWSVKWGWVQRAQAWDRYQDQLTTQKIVARQASTRDRHAKLAAQHLEALLAPSEAALKAMEKAGTLDTLVNDATSSPDRLLRLLEMVAMVARAMPGLVAIERLSLGLTTDRVEVEDRRGDDTFARRVATDPAAQELAFTLLDRIARSGSGERPPERLRLLSQPGDVEASAAPDAPDEEAD